MHYYLLEPQCLSKTKNNLVNILCNVSEEITDLLETSEWFLPLLSLKRKRRGLVDYNTEEHL